MLFGLYLVLVAGALLLALLTFDDDLHERRLRRKGRITIDDLQEKTGWTRRKVEEALGPLPDKDVYSLSEETFRRLPWNPWVAGPAIPFLNLVSLAGLLWIGGRSCWTSRPDWLLLAVLGGYQAFALGWEIVVFFFVLKTHEDPEKEPAPEPSASLSESQGIVESLRQDLQRELREDSVREDVSPLWRRLYCWIDRRQIRSIARWEARIESLSADYTRLFAKVQTHLTRVRWELLKAEAKRDEARAADWRAMESELLSILSVRETLGR